MLAGAAGPVTAQEVLDRLPGPLAYTTVMTTLNRLCAKGALVRQPTHGRAFAYVLSAPTAEIPAALTARAMTQLLEAGPDRAGALARFVFELDPEDERVLRGLLARHRPRRPGRDPAGA